MVQMKRSLKELDIPEGIRRLPRDDRGFPIPWFVYRDSVGIADFRVADQSKLFVALKHDLCWVCGSRLGRRKAFVLGPMCTVTRTTAEPPCHRACAAFSAKACPFLTRPRMRRNDKDMPADAEAPPGIAIMRNPGVVAIWVTRSYRLMPVDTGLLIKVGEPEEVRWLVGGEAASRAEVMHSIRTGLPVLVDEAQRESEEAARALMVQVQIARQYLPTEGDVHAGQRQAPARHLSQGTDRAGGEEAEDDTACVSRRDEHAGSGPSGDRETGAAAGSAPAGD